jgi:hypothetical protein
MRSARDQVRVRKTVLDHLHDLSHWVLHFRLRSRSVHCRAAASDCPVDHPRHPTGNDVRPNRNRRRCAARFSCGWIANMGSGVFANRSCARYRSTFRSAGSRWAFSLHAQSALSGKSANGGWNWRLSQPLWICFSGAGKLDFCLSADSSRRRIPAENPKGIISRVLPSGAAFLACAKGACSVRKSPPRLGSGLRRRELCLVVRFRRAVDRRDSESPARSSRVFARVRRAFFNYATHPKAPMRVTGVVGRLLAGVTACLSYKMQKSQDIAVVTLA